MPGSLASLALFFIVVFFVLSGILWGAYRAGNGLFKKMLIFLFCWVLGLSGVVVSGLPQKYILPVAPLIFLSILLCGLGVGLSSWGKRLSALNIWQLAFFQSFRLPLEVVLYLWAKTQTVPVTMTWTGQNWDIVSGILACLVVIRIFRNRYYLWLVNITGIILLLNVIRVVIFSSPLPFAWNLERPLQLIFYMPYALIGFVCVWGAVLGHVVLSRALLQGADNGQR